LEKNNNLKFNIMACGGKKKGGKGKGGK